MLVRVVVLVLVLVLPIVVLVVIVFGMVVLVDGILVGLGVFTGTPEGGCWSWWLLGDITFDSPEEELMSSVVFKVAFFEFVV